MTFDHFSINKLQAPNVGSLLVDAREPRSLLRFKSERGLEGDTFARLKCVVELVGLPHDELHAQKVGSVAPEDYVCVATDHDSGATMTSHGYHDTIWGGERVALVHLGSFVVELPANVWEVNGNKARGAEVGDDARSDGHVAVFSKLHEASSYRPVLRTEST